MLYSLDDGHEDTPRFLPEPTIAHWDMGTVVLIHNVEGWFVGHVCIREHRGTIICAPQLVDHDIVVRDNQPTVTPSILCSDCGLHGFISAGEWMPV